MDSILSVLERTSARASSLLHNLSERYRKLNYWSKMAVLGYVGIHIGMMFLLWLVTPARLFAWIAGWAEGLREAQFGWLLLFGMIVITSIPPLFGYGTCITLCGFAFGVRNGWLIAMAGCLTGAVVSFTLTRRLITTFAPLLARDKTFKALAAAVRAKGLPLVVLIRLCPFPFPYSNAFFASIESVSLLHFGIATLAITPKLFLHVWLGSRMYALADPTSRGKMDTNTKIINGASVLLGTLLGAFTSWYLYRLTMQYVQQVTLEDLDSDGELNFELDEDELDDDDRERNGGRGSRRERGLQLRREEGVGLMGDIDALLDADTNDNANAEAGHNGTKGRRLSEGERGRKSDAGRSSWEGTPFSDFDEEEARDEEAGVGDLINEDAEDEGKENDLKDKGMRRLD